MSVGHHDGCYPLKKKNILQEWTMCRGNLNWESKCATQVRWPHEIERQHILMLVAIHIRHFVHLSTPWYFVFTILHSGYKLCEKLTLKWVTAFSIDKHTSWYFTWSKLWYSVWMHGWVISWQCWTESHLAKLAIQLIFPSMQIIYV